MKTGECSLSIKNGMWAVVILLVGYIGGHAAYAEDAASPAPIPVRAGLLTKSARIGTWGYGCAYPDKTGKAHIISCGVGGPFRSGVLAGAIGGSAIFLRVTSDVAQRPIAQQSWGVLVIFPRAVAVDQTVPAQLVVDQTHKVLIPWAFCSFLGCQTIARVLHEDFLQIMKAGKQARFIAKQKDGTLWSYDFTLDGVNTGITQINQWIEHGELTP